MKDVPKLSCSDAGELLLEFLENTLSPDLQSGLRKHFENCRPCLSFLEGYKKTPGLCKKALLKEMPREVSDRLMSFLRSQTRGGSV